jgi:8-oxo-dGTP pyrophosphatase MutT (NUDIX family)
MSRPLRDQIRAALARRDRKVVTDPGFRRAAVLVPLYEDADGLQVLFTRRSEELPLHRGQIAFPGGGHRPDDSSLRATALRESREEIGLTPSDVEIVGELDDTVTVTSRFVVAPFVGFIPYPYPFQLNTAEIVELIPLPLSVLSDPSRFKEELWDRGGAKAPVYSYTIGPLVIWGLTARILKQLLDTILLHGQPAP